MIPRFFDWVNIPQGGAPQVIGGFIIPWKLVRYITNKNPSEIGVINAPTKNAIERPGAPSCILVCFQHHPSYSHKVVGLYPMKTTINITMNHYSPLLTNITIAWHLRGSFWRRPERMALGTPPCLVAIAWEVFRVFAGKNPWENHGFP